MKIEYIEYFITLADTLNYSEAADTLFISQPSLSKAIKALENELGVMLFHRNSRKVVLTEAGVLFLNNAKNITYQYKQALQQLYPLINKRMTIEVMPLTFQEEIADMLASFYSQYPESHLRIIEKDTIHSIENLKRGTIDCAIMRYDGNDSDIEAYPIVSNKIVLAVAKNHPLANKKVINLKELTNETLLSFNQSSEIYKKTIELLRENDVHLKLQGSEIRANTMTSFILRKQGVAILTDNMIKNEQGLVGIPIENNPSLTVSLVKLKKSSLNLTKCLITFISKYFNS